MEDDAAVMDGEGGERLRRWWCGGWRAVRWSGLGEQKEIAFLCF